MPRIGNTASRGIKRRGKVPSAYVDGVFQSQVLEVVSPELLEILVCPRSKKRLQLADTATLDQVNERIRSGKCKEISGVAVTQPATEGLLQKDTGIFYFIREEIPVLIYDNAVELK